MTITKAYVAIRGLAAVPTALAIIASVGCAIQHHAPDLSDLTAIHEIGVRTSRRSIETGVATVQFAGRVVYKSGGKVRPVPDAHFFAVHNTGERVPVDVAVAIDGTFSHKVRLLMCRSYDDEGQLRGEWPHRKLFIITADGCEDQSVLVGGRWRMRSLKMTCAARQ